MPILVDNNTRALIQGITGTEGSRACKEMLAYGTQVLAGVTPGKGGRAVEGVPVYDTVREALAAHPGINASLVAVPPAAACGAAREALAAGIPLVNILAEYVPARDSSVIVAHARRAGARVVGPASIGIISPGKGKLGSIGSGEIKNVFAPGPIGVISKSGGMTAEISYALTRAGWGQSTAVGIGGDIIAGSDYADLLALFENDPETEAVVMFGEVGGTYEEDAAACIAAGKFTKPAVALVAGRFAAALSQGAVLGHAGAIVAKGRGGYESKVRALAEAGVRMADAVEDIPGLLAQALGRSPGF